MVVWMKYSKLIHIKKRWDLKSKFKSMLIIFFDINVTVHKKFSLAVKQSITPTIVMFCGSWMKMYEDLPWNLAIMQQNTT
jgi:hypothetical protein